MKRHEGQSARALATARRALCVALRSMSDAMEMEALLTDLCTPAELEALADRWRVARLVAAELPYREIHERTSVSVTTIGRVARCIEFGAGGYRTALDRTADLNRTGSVGADRKPAGQGGRG